MIEFLFLDLDDTILDFKLAEHKALQASLREFGIEPTDAICSRYSQINQLQKDYVTKEFDISKWVAENLALYQKYFG